MSTHGRLSLLRHLFALTLVLVPFVAAAQGAEPACGHLGNSFGPFDYRAERGNSLHLVESAHFTPVVEALIRGSTGNIPGPDIDYTLRAYPNHHRALAAVVKLAERDRTPQPRGMRYSVDCWFDRAMRFRPADLTVRMLFASHLGKTKRRDKAQEELAFVAASAGENGFTQYNVGLMYFQLGDYDRALAQAHVAANLGFTRAELRKQLEEAGKWSDSAGPAAPAAAASAAPLAASGPEASASSP